MIGCVLAACLWTMAQTPPTGTLRITVVDPSNAIVVGATVTAAAADAPVGREPAPGVPSGGDGVATIAGLAPGRYTITIEFPGFETRTLKDVRVRAGDNRQVAVLAIQKLETSVTVEEDKQRAAADPRGSS